VGRADVLVLLVIGVLLLAAFVLAESRVAEPMLELSLLRNPGFVTSCGGAFFTGLAIVGIMSYLPTIFERSLGQSPLAAGSILAIWSGLSFVVALQARRFATRVPAITQVAGSLLVCAVGEAALYGLHAGGSWLRVAPGLAIVGIGSGILNAALARLAVASVPPQRSAMGSGANNTARYIGSSLGVAVIVTVVAQGTSARGPAEALAVGANQAVVVSALLCLAGALICALARVAEIRAAPAPVPAQGAESATVPHGATADKTGADG
jgi:Major Facilitator Superfamily